MFANIYMWQTYGRTPFSDAFFLARWGLGLYTYKLIKQLLLRVKIIWRVKMNKVNFLERKTV